MISSLVFSLQKVLPFFILIFLGIAIRRKGFLTKEFFQQTNKFVYRIALPISLFLKGSGINWDSASELSFLGVVFVFAVGSFLIIWLVSEVIFKEKNLIGTIVQGAFRSNYILLGIPLLSEVAGEGLTKYATMVSAVTIPTYSILAIFILTIRGSSEKKVNIWGVLKKIATNPLFVATIAGLIISLFRINIPIILFNTAQYIGNTATPLGLMAIGGMFNFQEAKSKIKPAIFSSIIKIIILPLGIVFVAYLIGFRKEMLFLFFIVFGSPVAVSSYSVATEMGGDKDLASNILIITTLFSSLTLSIVIYIMRFLSWI